MLFLGEIDKINDVGQVVDAWNMLPGLLNFTAGILPANAVSNPHKLVAGDCIDFRCEFGVSTCYFVQFRASAGIEIGLDEISFILASHNEIEPLLSTPNTLTTSGKQL